MTLDRVIKFFSIMDDSKLNKYEPLINFRIRASNKDDSLFRSTIKLDEFIGNLFSFLFMIGQFLFHINTYMNEFEMKRVLIFALFKNFELNGIMMKKIKNLQEFYNEVEVNKLPNFKVEKEKDNNMVNEDNQKLSSKENFESIPNDETMTSKII